MSRRVLQVGYGRIGREVFAEYCDLMELMVTDPDVGLPMGFEWDGFHVDLAMIVVDTPAGADSHLSPGLEYDYGPLASAVEEYLDVAEYIVIRSTVGLGFLDLEVYVANAHRIGFWPEFYGTTEHSRRGELYLPFVVLSEGVPEWFVDAITDRTIRMTALTAPAPEVIVAKLAENAYLATKVTFFHELALTCRRLGLSFDAVREMVTSDPRIGPGHSYCDDGLGWSSHCFDKDVPVFAALGPDTRLVRIMQVINAEHLTREPPHPQPLSYVLRDSSKIVD